MPDSKKEVQSERTPGPWSQETLGAQLRAVKISGEKARRIMVQGGPAIAYLPEGRKDIQEANAQLISASPDLFEACKAQHEAIDLLFSMLIQKDPKFFPTRSGHPWEAMVKGSKAIAKAEGKS